ncbi:SGNH/GDSL hydrolase family protein [Psychrilyobacter atlanticus]|uniref:SGNH/GDSL hydrolase family protein n=1 Tax=Psychrilyobacter atlanticus TaxID=271091 RepID=UPI00041A59C0|nr:SGNH/GDSL hydrolase family protein [Psychrilyobacter atlanticus]
MKAESIKELKYYKNKNSKALTILAEGDSWFDYPRNMFFLGPDANIIDHLYDKKDLIIYNMASNGDEAVEMLSGENKFKLIKALESYKFDILLFSGGGNDIVGGYDFNFILNEKKDSMKWKDCINLERLEIKIDQIKSSYKFLCEIAKDYPNIKIVSHTYDLCPPSKTGFKPIKFLPTTFGDGWLKVYLTEKKIYNYDDQKNIIDYILKALREILIEIDKKYDNFTVVDTQGTLGDKHWRDELHPNSVGFELISQKIYKALV